MRKQIVTCDVCESDCTEPFIIRNTYEYCYEPYRNVQKRISASMVFSMTVPEKETMDICPSCMIAIRQGAIDAMLAKARPEQEPEFEPEPVGYVNVYRSSLDSSATIMTCGYKSQQEATFASKSDPSWIETVPVYRRKAKPEPVE